MPCISAENQIVLIPPQSMKYFPVISTVEHLFKNIFCKNIMESILALML